ncbi:hypothetical protein PG993_003331 [Apiospora rasikravindrae]|uniref:Uncharacterized protein n=1 Tax=Apiospora rasikravindrae TaxID=990691 RepID=A0ABR1TZ74_9PEZI
MSFLFHSHGRWPHGHGYQTELAGNHEASDKAELPETLSKNIEELFLVVIEKDRMNGDFHTERKKSEEHHPDQIDQSIHERGECLETERDGACSKCGDLSIGTEQPNAQITAVHEKHDAACERLRENEMRYEEVSVTMPEYIDGHDNF